MRVLVVEGVKQVKMELLEPLLTLPDLHVQLARTHSEAERLLAQRKKIHLGIFDASADLRGFPGEIGSSPIVYALRLEKRKGDALLFSSDPAYQSISGKQRLQEMFGNVFDLIEMEAIQSEVEQRLERHLAPILEKIITEVRATTGKVCGDMKAQLQEFVGSMSAKARIILQELLPKEEATQWGFT